MRLTWARLYMSNSGESIICASTRRLPSTDLQSVRGQEALPCCGRDFASVYKHHASQGFLGAARSPGALREVDESRRPAFLSAS